MITAVSAFGVYLLKATLFSGILYAYYHFALRDKQTFGWNRFYLLASALLTAFVPFLNIPLHLEAGARETPAFIQVLGVVPGTADNMTEYAVQASPHSFPWAFWAVIVYAGAAAVLLGLFGVQVWRLSRLRRHASLRELDDVHLIGTDAPGTPFSFFHWIFWDNRLPLDSDEGRRILLHELAHVNAKHSLDKVLLQVLCAVLFPVLPLYLIRRELQLVHEYQADYEATGRRDIDAYASYLVKHAMNAPAYDLSNAFHQHPLLRRIAMMNRAGALQGNASTWRRWMALPLLFCGFGLFAFTVKQTFVYSITLSAPRTLTVVIDAGHGGNDPGAQAGGKMEKDINLAIARDVERLSAGYPVHILLSRDVDSLVPIRGRVQFCDENKADLFVSLHTNVTTGIPIGQHGQLTASNGKPYGIEAYVSSRNRFYDSSIVLGSVLLHHLQEVYPSEHVLREQKRGITVLATPDCPAVLIECGFLDQPADAKFMSQSTSQEKVAREILLALSDYAAGAGAKGIPVQHIPH